MQPKRGDVMYFPPTDITEDGEFRIVTHMDQQDDGSWRVASGTVRNIGQWYTCATGKADTGECILIPSEDFAERYTKIIESFHVVFG